MVHVLVVVASRHGATWEIGEWLSDTLRDGGHVVSHVRPGPNIDPHSADAVVLGSATYSRRWLGDARAWVAHVRDALAARPVWLFDAGMAARTAADNTPSGDAARVGALVGALGFRHFGGRLDRASLSRSERAVVGALRAPDDDARVRPDIERWAGEIGRELDIAETSDGPGAPDVPGASDDPGAPERVAPAPAPPAPGRADG